MGVNALDALTGVVSLFLLTGFSQVGALSLVRLFLGAAVIGAANLGIVLKSGAK